MDCLWRQHRLWLKSWPGIWPSRCWGLCHQSSTLLAGKKLWLTKCASPHCCHDCQSGRGLPDHKVLQWSAAYAPKLWIHTRHRWWPKQIWAKSPSGPSKAWPPRSRRIPHDDQPRGQVDGWDLRALRQGCHPAVICDRVGSEGRLCLECLWPNGPQALYDQVWVVLLLKPVSAVLLILNPIPPVLRKGSEQPADSSGPHPRWRRR